MNVYVFSIQTINICHGLPHKIYKAIRPIERKKLCEYLLGNNICRYSR